MEIITKSSKETKDLGRKIGSSLKGGSVLALVGQMGAGKTTFVQGLAEGLGVKGIVNSPTFIIMKRYPIQKETDTKNFLYHVDLYRLEENIHEEVRNLGVFDLWRHGTNIFVIEWSERIESSLPEETILITIESLPDENRRILFPEGLLN